MTLDVLAGKIDFLELAQFCVPEGPLAVDHYYHFLDLGYRLTALAGSDFPGAAVDGEQGRRWWGDKRSPEGAAERVGRHCQVPISARAR
jgi:hypothetical protein